MCFCNYSHSTESNQKFRPLCKKVLEKHSQNTSLWERLADKYPSAVGFHEWYHEEAHHHSSASAFIPRQIVGCNREDCGLNAVTFLLQIISFVCSFNIF